LKKGIWLISTILALVLSAVLGTAAFACGPTPPPPPSSSDNTSVTISNPTVDGSLTVTYIPGFGIVGTPITVSGTITITSESEASGLGAFAGADSDASYMLVGPDGTISSGSISDSDFGVGILHAEANASVVYHWSYVFIPGKGGTYIITQDGDASAWWLTLLPYRGDSSSDDATKTTTFFIRTVIVGVPSYRHTGLWLVFPDGYREPFYASDGFNSGTVTKDIVASHGGIIIKIPAGTKILMDGQGQLQMWLVFDAKGGVTGKYGYNFNSGDMMGTSTATTVTFSQPISFTSK
jgi:hypothetical protein